MEKPDFVLAAEKVFAEGRFVSLPLKDFPGLFRVETYSGFMKPDEVPLGTGAYDGKKGVWVLRVQEEDESYPCGDDFDYTYALVEVAPPRQ